MKGFWKAKKSPLVDEEMGSQDTDIVIAIMGVTGAGKSSFIASVTGQKDVQVGHDLYSETSEVKSYRFTHESNNYVLIDTPGFDDSSMSNEEVTAKVLQWLESSYRNGTRLNGIIYIHDIKKPRMQGSAFKNMRLFSQLCGDDALGNVILATSFWDQVTESVGAQRELELKTSKEFWGNMVAKGSEVVRIRPDRAVYLDVLKRIALKNKVDMLVQTEVPVPKKTLFRKLFKKEAEHPPVELNEVQKFEETLATEREVEKRRFWDRLDEDQKVHKDRMKQLRKEQGESQRIVKQDERLSKKKHKRDIRDDKRQMRQSRLEIEESLYPLRAEFRKRRGLFMFTALWLFLSTCLIGNVMRDSTYGTPACINYPMVSIVWAWIALLVNIGYCFLDFHLGVVLILEVSATFFVFWAAVELAANLGVINCRNNDSLVNNLAIDGSSNLIKRCRELQASVAFLWFIWAGFAIITAINIRKYGGVGKCISALATTLNRLLCS